MNDDRIIKLLEEIRDNQQHALELSQASAEHSKRALELYAGYRADALKTGRKAAIVLVIIIAAVLLLLLLGPLSGSFRCKSRVQMPPTASLTKPFGPDAKIETNSVEAHSRGANVIFVGNAKNNGSSSWQALTFEATLFDNAGKILDKCPGYIQGSLPPGEERGFKIDCGGRGDNPIPAYSRFEVVVTNAYPVYSGQQSFTGDLGE